MKLLVATTASIALFASVANAGNLLMEAPVEAEVISEAPAGSMGGSAVWLLPLLALGTVALLVSQSSEEACIPTKKSALQQPCTNCCQP